MKILFLTLLEFESLNQSNIYTDLLRTFVNHGHEIYAISPAERRTGGKTHVVRENGAIILRLRTFNIQKTNIIEKSISTLTIQMQFKTAVKKYFSDIKFDLILYSTPPITLVKVVKYIKKRDGAIAYLMLKDIFPQNAVDIGILSKNGVKGLIYKYFRRKEKELYEISDRIGCMSEANVKFLLKQNQEITSSKVGICHNSIEVKDFYITTEEKVSIRKKYELPADKHIFVYGGNLGRPQGIPFIIKCLELQLDNPDVFFLVIGSGTEYGKLVNFFDRSNPKNMKLISSLPKRDYDMVIAACDVGMIFLDYRFTTPNFPSRLLGYMQAKLPVFACTDLCTDIGEVIVNGGFGWWCSSDDPSKFTEKVNEILQDTTRNEKANASFRFLMEHYNVDNEYNTIIRTLGR